jgi:quercetin dioxygenase-like cupin family protein
MRLTRNTTETSTGPSDWFTGTVYMDPVAVPGGAYGISATNVHFTPGARTAWHAHPNGQTIFVTDGVGLAQGRGDAIQVIRPGDRVFFAPGEDHWHGASASRFMTHLSLVQADAEGNTATWGAHVTDEEYAAAPRID